MSTIVPFLPLCPNASPIFRTFASYYKYHRISSRKLILVGTKQIGQKFSSGPSKSSLPPVYECFHVIPPLAQCLRFCKKKSFCFATMDSKTHWVAVYTKPQKEIYAEWNLRLRGMNTFFPKLLLPKTSKRKERVVPLFPNYLFVQCAASSRECSGVVWCPGVSRVVSFNGTPAIIDDLTILVLRNQASADGLIVARSSVQAGQKVSINGGALSGLLGIIERPPNAQGRVRVLLQLLNRQTSVDVPVEFIEASWVASMPVS
jgi:transcription antitermination factor NusG